VSEALNVTEIVDLSRLCVAAEAQDLTSSTCPLALRVGKTNFEPPTRSLRSLRSCARKAERGRDSGSPPTLRPRFVRF
jgi:hypothetical protein